jgi:predicted dehydrogenase
MEGVWSRFLPAYRAVGELLAEDRIGPVRMVEGSFGFAMPFDPSHRLFDRSLGGGALLDLGIYPLQLCSLVLGAPDRVVADGHVGTAGVDEQVVAVLHHPDGGLGVVQAAIRTNLRNDARIVGERGTIELPPFMHAPDHLVLTTVDGRERIAGDWEGDGLRFQVDHVHQCLSDGRTESPIVPLDESVRLAATMDAIRRQLGVAYPGEPDHPSP